MSFHIFDERDLLLEKLRWRPRTTSQEREYRRILTWSRKELLSGIKQMIDIERKGMLNHTHSEISISSTCSQTFHYLPKRVSFRDDYLTSIPTESRNAETRAQRNCAEPVTRSLSMLMIEFEAEKELRKQTDPRDSGTSLDFIPVNVKDEMIIKPKAEGDLRKIKKCLDLLKTTLT